MIEFFYDLFYMLPLGVALILSALGVGLGSGILVSVDGASMPPLAGCLVSGLFIFIVLALRYSGKKERVLIGGILVVSVASFFGILGKDKREILYARYSWIIVVFTISIIAMLLGRMTERLIQAKIVVSIILLAGNIYMMVNRMQCPKGTLGCCALVVMIYLLEIVQNYWRKSGYTDVKSHVGRIAPIMLIMVLVITFIPAPAEKFEWRMAKNFWKAAVTEYNRLIRSMTAEKEEYVYTGFSEDGGVRAGVSDSGREVIVVTSDRKTFDRLYMGGMAYEDFDGKKWSTRLDSEPGVRELDFIETKAAISKFNQGYEREYLKIDNVKVENRLFNTKYIFAPAKANMSGSKTVLPNYKETESKILSDKKMKYGDSYSIDYMQLNFDNPNLILMVDTAKPLDEDEWDEALKKNNLADAADMSYMDYLEYRDGIYEKYGGSKELTMEEALENAQLSDEVKCIVKEVIAGDETGDYEKLRALSDYFQEMQYTKKTEALPKGIDNAASYLDYFLLESQSGYCVHYATAFTLLARQLGHPARYVQGYYVKRADTDTLVTEDRAHAWAEVYFDNFGWILFEATPGYSVSEGWNVSGTTGDKKEIRLNAPVINNTVSNVNMDELPQEEEKGYVYILYFIIPLICAVFFSMIYLLISRVIAEKKYSKMNEEEKVRTMISKNLRILRILGYFLGENETLEEYKKKIAADKEIVESIEFLSLYENLLYSDYKVCMSDVEVIENDYSLLKDSLRAKGGKYRMTLLFI